METSKGIGMAFRKTHLHNYPARVAVGMFILNSGMNKLIGDENYLEHVFSTAITAYPFLESAGASKFGKVFGTFEVMLGSILLAPIFSDVTAGSFLVPFSLGLVGLYIKIPGMRLDGSLRPSGQGIALAKDSWLLGVGLSLLFTRSKVAAKDAKLETVD